MTIDSIFLLLLSFVFNLSCFFLIAKARIFTSSLIAFLRTLGSYLYFPFLFPSSDQSLLYWPEVLKCDSQYSNLSFYSFASFLHCSIGIDSLTHVNIFYGLLGSLCLCICYRSLRSISFTPLNLSFDTSRKFLSYDFLLLLFCLDPSSIFYTSAFGKDLPTFLLVFSFFSLLCNFRKHIFSPVFIVFVFTILSSFSDRLYSVIVLILSLFLSFFLPSFSLSPRFPYLRPYLVVSSRLRLATIFIFFVVFTVFTLIAFYGVFKYFSYSSALDLFTQFSTDMGGNLQVPGFIPTILRPLAFLFLPLPFLPFSLSALPLSVSSVLLLYLLFKLFTLSFQSRGISLLSVFLSLFFIIVLMFGLSMTNFGISNRYRAQYLMPAISALLLTASGVSSHSIRQDSLS